MKILKFRRNLSKLIIKGEKTTTWRLFDDKNISEGDDLSLVVWETKEKFAEGKVISVKETKFANITKEEKEDHENFLTEEEMYKTYSKYYNHQIDENTTVKIIKFKLA